MSDIDPSPSALTDEASREGAKQALDLCATFAEAADAGPDGEPFHTLVVLTAAQVFVASVLAQLLPPDKIDDGIALYVRTLKARVLAFQAADDALAQGVADGQV